MRRAVAGVAFVMLAGLLLLGPSSVLAKPCIAVVPAGGGYAFWGEVERGAHRAADELGLELYFRGPSDENNSQAQKDIISVIEQMRCIGLVLAPNVAELNVDTARLTRRGIPVVHIDRDFANSSALAVVATDNYRAGELAAQQLALMLKGQGRVAMFRMKRGVQSTDERERGFITAARAAGLSIVLEDWLGSSVGEARQRSQKILGALKIPLDAIFTPNESTTLGTLYTLDQLGQAGQIKLIGFDMSRDFVRALQNGSLAGVVVQRPMQMGYLGVQIAYKAAHGIPPLKHNVDTGAFFVTAATLRGGQYADELAPFLKPDRR